MRVFLAEDQYLLRQGLERLLASQGVEVVGSVATADEFLSAVGESLTPAHTARPPMDLALLDIRMPPTNTDEGIRAALELRRRRRGFPVVLLSQYVEHVYLDELLGDGAGAIGYLLKDRVFDDVSFVESLRTVAGGGTVVDPEVIVTLMQRQAARGRLSSLTPRETEVLSRMAQGDANASIAERLVITEKAVLKHINAIFSKLGLAGEATSARRVMAVLAFLRGR
ncbi:two component transcriptional regulator, LuxR family [Tessaracoccus bendigoensis DSM 12906]|uniref:Two component transcriptional regulator, LuxR family n=2 Tax=Tessaracoccus TaxID=72763 RepID=A0A1M6NZT6_9ACTN|nr:response regulator transcription factor [Tessaracoccus bendigoensis]SHK01186.1 two component transcriptional regulator, LuxR family [Tessaracoccus bendigoensis DSM 12906]